MRIISIENETRLLRCATYGRGSSEMQHTTLENQADFLKAYVEECNIGTLEDRHIYSEYAVSGSKTLAHERPAFRELLQAIDNKEIDCVIVKSISRAFRDFEDQNTMLDLLQSKDVVFISIEEGYDSRNDNDLTLKIKGVLAEYETKQIMVRVRMAMKAKALRGEWIGTPPYGYRLVNRRLVINEEEASIVRKIFAIYVNEGLGGAELAKFFNMMNVPTRKGREWSTTTILNVISNEAYIGRLVAFKTRKIAKKIYDNGLLVGKKITTVNIPEKDWIIVDDAHPPIIDVATFEKAVKIKEESGKHLIGKTNNKVNINSLNLLLGYFHCGKCGSPMRALSRKSGKNKEYTRRSYDCSLRNSKGSGSCTQPRIQATEIEEAVFHLVQERVRTILYETNIGERLENVQSERQEHLRRIEEYKESISQTRADAVDLFRNRQKYMEEVYFEINEGLTQRINHLKRLLEESQRDYEKLGNEDSYMEYVRAIGEEFLHLDISNNREVRKCFQLLLDSVHINDDKIKLNLLVK